MIGRIIKYQFSGLPEQTGAVLDKVKCINISMSNKKQEYFVVKDRTTNKIDIVHPTQIISAL